MKVTRRCIKGQEFITTSVKLSGVFHIFSSLIVFLRFLAKSFLIMLFDT